MVSYRSKVEILQEKELEERVFGDNRLKTKFDQTFITKEEVFYPWLILDPTQIILNCKKVKLMI